MRVCLVTTGQPSSNPRLVKEADTLAAAGYDVHVIGAHWAEWATEADTRRIGARPWSLTLIEWRRESAPFVFWKSRVRHRLALACLRSPAIHDWAMTAAVSRLTPELTRAALATPADLYIAHNLGALPAAAAAAARHHARLGFDAEDFHRGQFPSRDRSPAQVAAEDVERRFIPRCDYVTAAAPGIATVYAPLAAGPPVCLLNVFPLAQRPETRRPTAPSGPLTLYWFSQRVGPARGLEDAVRALGAFKDGTVELHLRGQIDSSYRDRLDRVAEASGANRDRLIVHPPSDPDEMIREAARYDVGLALEPGAPINNDLAVSNKIFTYLLAGCAVVATRTTGQAAVLDTIPDASMGYTAGDVAGLTERLRVWTDDRGRLDRARAAAWDAGTTRYNWDLESRRFLEVVAGVLAEAPRRQSSPAPAPAVSARPMASPRA